MSPALQRRRLYRRVYRALAEGKAKASAYRDGDAIRIIYRLQCGRMVGQIIALGGRPRARLRDRVTVPMNGGRG